MIWGTTEVPGWFFTKKWHYYQQRKGKVSSYVEMMMGFYRVHVTYSGLLSMCDIEVRCESPEEAFRIAEAYLDRYKDVPDKRTLWNDWYSPHNEEGYYSLVYPFRYVRGEENDWIDKIKNGQEMNEWLNKEHCPKCGIVELPKDYSFAHCESCRKH